MHGVKRSDHSSFEVNNYALFFDHFSESRLGAISDPQLAPNATSITPQGLSLQSLRGSAGDMKCIQFTY